ncbi:NADH-quinone oxidoreductase subunit C [Dechloromonas sp. ZY10]|uniref:NADH-quinone oxidoreductase subunit C n=1 Tax=Dechloromonas aquae TaxID=2664436 RepID=UPI003529713F
MSAKLEALCQSLQDRFGGQLKSIVTALGEVTVEVSAQDYLQFMLSLRDEQDFSFEEVTDLCGVDYSAYGNGSWQGRRFAVVVHLLSVRHNRRLRVRVFAEDDEFPVVPSIIGVWKSANWFEREAFDLFGVAFPGHDDLRRILTDYGFIGHPFRKDFPISGHVEMRYDPDQGRVVYQPVSIEPRENTPRIVREDTYGDVAHG